MHSRAAILDLGTNTFHLLVLEWEGRRFWILERKQVPVKLGKGAFGSHLIQDAAFERGLETMSVFRELIEKHCVNDVEIYGTSVLRSAENGHDFVLQAEKIIGYPIKTINGREEAELIFEGVKGAIPLGNEPHLVMDIGGGSVEFIIGNSKEIFWMRSYEVGAARLIEKFPKNDPIDIDTIRATESYLENELEEVWEQSLKYKVRKLVGASGTFESIASIERKRFGIDKRATGTTFQIIDLTHFREIYSKIIHSTQEELLYLPGLPAFRVEMVPVTVVMMNYVINRIVISKVIASDYALKEGVMFRIMDGHANAVPQHH